MRRLKTFFAGKAVRCSRSNTLLHIFRLSVFPAILGFKRAAGVFLFSVVWQQLQAQNILTINNSQPRLDTKGQIVDAHDGRVVQFGNRFYWYGTQYGATNGFTTANQYVCYSYTDLKTWTPHGPLLAQKPQGTYYRPHVVYNKRSKKYVLWYNWYPKLWDGQFGVAVSDVPMGPFTIVNDNVPVKHSSLGVGDLGVFVDDDGKAYLSYNTIKGHQVSVEALNDDYTASTLQGSDFLARDCEAGSMFKRNGLYYLLTDYTCCFCTQGSGAKVFTASSPLGPYTYKQNINRYPGAASPVVLDGNSNDNFFEALQPKEEHKLELWLQGTQMVSSVLIYQFTGNRNGQCGQVDNPVVHETILQQQFVLESFANGSWKKIVVANPVVQSGSMQIKYSYRFAPVKAERLRITPLYKDSVQPVNISEVVVNTAQQKAMAFKTGKNEGKPVIPAQQTYVMELKQGNSTQYIWMDDLWGSASDNIKGHDYQFWSAPLQFYSNGTIKTLQWVNEFQLRRN